MDLVYELTVANLTPPGYFDLSADAPADHQAYITWWNNILNKRAIDAVSFKTMLLTPWLYNHPDFPRTPWLKYLTTLYGLGFFSGTNNQAAALYRLISSGWSTSTIYNMVLVAQTFSMPPFSWFTIANVPLTAGNLSLSQMDTGFIIYTIDPSPATPAPTQYSARGWTTPAAWSNAPASAVTYCRGYISGATIIWSDPRPAIDFENMYLFSTNIPVAVASAGTVCIVDDDGTGDKRSVYYSDGAAWRKNSAPNSDLGEIIVDQDRPVPDAFTVWAPNPQTVIYAIDSAVPPPADGPTQGFGSFASWAETAIFNGQITLIMSQVDGGSTAIATTIEVLRRIKPVGKTFNLDIDGTVYKISDVRQK